MSYSLPNFGVNIWAAESWAAGEKEKESICAEREQAGGLG
jgi:hypothetical protein